MTLVLEVTAEVEARLRAAAAERSMPVAEYATGLLERQVLPLAVRVAALPTEEQETIAAMKLAVALEIECQRGERVPAQTALRGSRDCDARPSVPAVSRRVPSGDMDMPRIPSGTPPWPSSERFVLPVSASKSSRWPPW